MTNQTYEAINLLKQMFQNNQHTWPSDMYVSVKVGQIKQVIELLGDSIEADLNTVGARKKDGT